MAQAPTKVAADAGGGGTTLDKLLNRLDAVGAKLDSVHGRLDALELRQKVRGKRTDDDDDAGRHDATPPPPGGDKEKAPGPPMDKEAGAPVPVAADKRKDAAPPPPPPGGTPPPPAPTGADDDDALRRRGRQPPQSPFAKDAEPPPPGEKEGEGKDKLPPFIKKDDDDDHGARADGMVTISAKDLNELRQGLADVRSRIPKDRSDADSGLMAQDQARCDSVAMLFGESAPRPLAGEPRPAYRLRILEPYKKHSAQWSKVDLGVVAVDEAALSEVERQIYAAATDAAKNPASVPEGTLRMVTTRTDEGHTERRFYGSPSVWLNRNAGNTRAYLTGLNLNPTNRR
jgi:hypothetical protein